MADPLLSIPGLGGYLSQKQRNEQQGAQQLQQYGTLVALQQKMQEQKQAAQDQQRNEAMMAEISALPPEQRNKATVLPIIMKYVRTPKELAGVLPDEQKPAAIGSGGLRLPDGTVVPPAARPDASPKAAPTRQRYNGTNVIQEELQPDGTWKQIGTGPRFAPEKPPAEKTYPIVTTGDGIFERRPEGLVRLKDPLTGKPLQATARERPITEFQGKNALYGSRATQADQTLLSIEEKINTVGLSTKQAVQGVPVVGGAMGAVGNVMLSADQQRVEQAQRNFVNAVLRQESGAVISDAEFENARKQYFPQPGDKPAVIAQKRQNRKTAIEGFKKIAGPAWPDEGKTSDGWSITPVK